MESTTSGVPASRARAVLGTKIRTFAFDSANDLARQAAQMVVRTIRERNAIGRPAVLGLSTGTTTIGVYRELIRLHREEGVDFSQVIAFGLGEYYGIAPEQLQSYHRWLDKHLLDHVNIPRENVQIPHGMTPPDQLAQHCRAFEAKIQEAGGIDLLLLTVGLNGHIAFNEPFSVRNSRTRLCTLDPVTRRVAAADFFSPENVPTHAITMGIASILEAQKIVVLAMGEHKAPIVRETVEGPVTDRVPASLLQEHGDALMLVDQAAAAELTACATPWLLTGVDWTDDLIKRAVLWLCEQTNKALLKLDDDDFRNHNLHALLRHYGPADRLAHRVFRWMSETIEYHPAGRDPRRVLVFSPHPDDDVISMGGALIRMNEDGHEVHIAYMTSGNIAVFDHDARRVADLMAEFNRLFGIDLEQSRQVEQTVAQALASKAPGDPDVETVLRIKGLIRWSEAKAGAIKVGCREEHLHFLDLPFYRTGTIDKRPLDDEDIRLVRETIERVDPHLVYLAGDLSDPHGTHRVCAQAIFEALLQIERAGGRRPEVLLYRGAWQEYPLHQIQIALPLSPSDLRLKREAIFMHESQKDSALFPGSDPREFWQRAEDRNKGTADKYNRIGLPEYYAMEAFVRWDGVPI